MKLLVDTHIFIWDALSIPKLSQQAKTALDAAEQQQTLWVADMSLWEVFMLARRGRIRLPVSGKQFIELRLQARGYQIQHMTLDIAQDAVSFGAEINNDPADRLIVASARYLGATLLSADNNLQSCGLVSVLA